jgi:hypothetical protein
MSKTTAIYSLYTAKGEPVEQIRINGEDEEDCNRQAAACCDLKSAGVYWELEELTEKTRKSAKATR